MRTQRNVSARRSVEIPSLEKGEQAGLVLEGTLSFLTPVFGGGVRIDPENPQVKDRDPVTPVRGASVRGQLREWWRRACGFDEQGRPLPLDVLRSREAILWGWASTDAEPRRGWVSLEVDASRLTPAKLFPVLEKNVRKGRWEPNRQFAYGTFPLQPQNADVNRPAGTLYEYGGTFTVSLRAAPLLGKAHAAAAASWPGVQRLEDRLWDEVQRAWLAWTTFGGFGARTRRGFGAVQVEDAPKLRDVLTRLGWLDRCVVAGDGAGGDRICDTSNTKGTSGLVALELALGRLRDFRQRPGLARNPGQQTGRPGRSRWPEPDELRRLTRKAALGHEPTRQIHKFPRAAFGLPIIFHFQGERQGDPGDHTLLPAGKADRLASPLVLRPVADKKQIKAIALQLPQRPGFDGLLANLELRNKAHQVVAEQLDGRLTSAEQAQVPPLAECRHSAESGPDAVINPFLRFFRGQS